MKKAYSSPHHSNGKFQNKTPWRQPSANEMAATMRKFMFYRNERKPNRDLPGIAVDLNQFNSTDDSQLNVTWLGHSSLMININGFRILTDPVFEKRISLAGPTRYSGDLPVQTDVLGEIDVIIISHNHYDHLNRYSIKNLHHKAKEFVVPLGVKDQLVKWGVSGKKISELDWGDHFHYQDKLKITSTPAQHFSGRGLTDRNRTLWSSFVIQGPNHKLFFGGDSGYFDGFKLIGDQYGPFDMTFLETGAYNEKWRHIHMFPEETVQAHLDLGGKLLNPLHWATFNLSLHSWYDPMRRLTRAAEKLGVNVALPKHGETTVFGGYIPSDHWWEDILAIKN